MAQVKVFGLREHLDPIKRRLSDVIHSCVVEALQYPADKRAHRRIHLLLPTVVIIFAGCAATPKANLEADNPRQKAQIQTRLNEIMDACMKKEFDRLDSYHLYGPKFTKFSTIPPERQDAEAARKGEHDGIAPAKDITMRADDVKIDVFGDVAIATFVLRYGFDTGTGRIKKQARSTLVFVNDRGEWRIAHEHLSAISPGP